MTPSLAERLALKKGQPLDCRGHPVLLRLYPSSLVHGMFFAPNVVARIARAVTTSFIESGRLCDAPRWWCCPFGRGDGYRHGVPVPGRGPSGR